MGYYKMTMLEESLHIKGIFSFHFFEYVKNFRGKEEKHDFWVQIPAHLTTHSAKS